jgi:hypothetical protein
VCAKSLSDSELISSRGIVPSRGRGIDPGESSNRKELRSRRIFKGENQRSGFAG